MRQCLIASDPICKRKTCKRAGTISVPALFAWNASGTYAWLPYAPAVRQRTLSDQNNSDPELYPAAPSGMIFWVMIKASTSISWSGRHISCRRSACCSAVLASRSAAFSAGRLVMFNCSQWISVKLRNTLTSVLATVDMVLIKMSSATPTTSLRVSPTVSPVTAALWAAEPLP